MNSIFFHSQKMGKKVHVFHRKMQFCQIWAILRLHEQEFAQICAFDEHFFFQHRFFFQIFFSRWFMFDYNKQMQQKIIDKNGQHDQWSSMLSPLFSNPGRTGGGRVKCNTPSQISESWNKIIWNSTDGMPSNAVAKSQTCVMNLLSPSNLFDTGSQVFIAP